MVDLYPLSVSTPCIPYTEDPYPTFQVRPTLYTNLYRGTAGTALQPVQPVQPVQPFKPVEPLQPVQPEQPVKHVQPVKHFSIGP